MITRAIARDRGGTRVAPSVQNVPRMKLRRLAMGFSLTLFAACGGAATGLDHSPDGATPSGPDGATPSPPGSDGGVTPAPDGGAPPPTASGPHPFGSHSTSYAPGTLMPTGKPADLDSAAADFYDQWKAKFIVPGCAANTYYIDFNLGDGGSTFSVSEGHGYGMVIAALMAGHDPQAQKYFDGLYQFYIGHFSTNEPNSHLMGWAQDKSCNPVDGADSATDGDLDIAYALLLADRQWGSAGAIDYKTAALNIISDIAQFDTNPSTNYLRLGDWATAGDTKYYYGSRPSDYMLDHFRSFQAASGDARWKTILDNTYFLISNMQAGYSATPGLLPDFVINTNATAAPAGANYLEDKTDGQYAYNSCRVPWHLGTDFAVNGDARAKTAVAKIDAWIEGATGGDPSKIVDGYALDGSKVGSGVDMAFVAPFAVGAMAGASQTWLDSLYQYVVNQKLESRYFEDTIKVICLIILSGNWWAP